MMFSADSEKRPLRWLFTDTQGFLSAQDLSTMALSDLIRAILGNIEGATTPLSHKDILRLITELGDQVVCYGLTRTNRLPLTISQMVNIKMLPQVEAIQLFKVNARNFMDELYTYDVSAANSKARYYQGSLMKSPLSEPQYTEPTFNPKVQSMAEETTRIVLEMFSQAGFAAIAGITLQFVEEKSPSGQLWLLGATKLSFISKRQPRKKHMIRSKSSRTTQPLVLMPRELLSDITHRGGLQTVTNGITVYSGRERNTERVFAKRNKLENKLRNSDCTVKINKRSNSDQNQNIKRGMYNTTTESSSHIVFPHVFKSSERQDQRDEVPPRIEGKSFYSNARGYLDTLPSKCRSYDFNKHAFHTRFGSLRGIEEIIHGPAVGMHNKLQYLSYSFFFVGIQV